MVTRSSEYLRGTLDPLILKTLASGPLHGYAIARWLERETEQWRRFATAASSVLLQPFRASAGRAVHLHLGQAEDARAAQHHVHVPSGGSVHADLHHVRSGVVGAPEGAMGEAPPVRAALDSSRTPGIRSAALRSSPCGCRPRSGGCCAPTASPTRRPSSSTGASSRAHNPGPPSRPRFGKRWTRRLRAERDGGGGWRPPVGRLTDLFGSFVLLPRPRRDRGPGHRCHTSHAFNPGTTDDNPATRSPR